jgi:hypothetical protein
MVIISIDFPSGSKIFLSPMFSTFSIFPRWNSNSILLRRMFILFARKYIGQYPPNAWGLYNMHGNVSEWCNDWYDAYTDATIKNPTGPSQGKTKVWRGGSYMDAALQARSANRRNAEPELYLAQIGFRVVFVNE